MRRLYLSNYILTKTSIFIKLYSKLDISAIFDNDTSDVDY